MGAEHLTGLLVEIDADASGELTYDEFTASLKRQETQDFMLAPQVDLGQAQTLFNIMDRNGDGRVDLIEFVEGMEKLNSEAKGSDIQMLILQGKQVMQVCTDLRDIIDDLTMVPARPSQRDGCESIAGGESFSAVSERS